MGAEPGRRFLKQPAAKLEPVIVAADKNVVFFLSFHALPSWYAAATR